MISLSNILSILINNASYGQEISELVPHFILCIILYLTISTLFLWVSASVLSQIFEVGNNQFVQHSERGKQNEIDVESPSISNDPNTSDDDNNETPLEKLTRKAKANAAFILPLVFGFIILAWTLFLFKNGFQGGSFPSGGVTPDLSKNLHVDTPKTPVLGDCCKGVVETVKTVTPTATEEIISVVVESVKETSSN